MVNAGFFLCSWQPLKLGFMKGKASFSALKVLRGTREGKISLGLNEDFGTVIACQLSSSKQNQILS